MDNMTIYNAVRSVPETAKKNISAGRLKGKTDINPMWRIKTLTEQFGICGIGWKTHIVRTWIDPGANGEAITNVEILLFVKVDGAWSDGIPGIGGSTFIAKENSGLYTDDECYKKAYTDAISVACKALGIGADVYWDRDCTKYAPREEPVQNARKLPPEEVAFRMTEIKDLIYGTQLTFDSVKDWIKKKFGNYDIDTLSDEQFYTLCSALNKHKESA